MFAINSQSNESGSFTLLTITLVIPSLFFIFSLVSDLGMYYFERQRIQTVADTAAINAYNYLPNIEAAKSVADTYIKKSFLGKHSDFSVEVTPDDITVSFSYDMPLKFARYLVPGFSIPLIVRSRIKGTPFDALVLMDVSSYLSPAIDGNQAWGSSESWGAAYYFKELDPSPGFKSDLAARILTQQCFNPIFSKVKEAVIQIYTTLAQFSLNSVGLVISPGATSDYHIAKPVDLIKNGTNLNLKHYRPYHFKGDIACAAAAEQENTYLQYGFPITNEHTSRPVPMIIPGSWVMDPEYHKYLSVAEYIWMQATNSERDLDLVNALYLVKSQLLSSKMYSERGALLSSPLKTGVIFIGALPELTSIQGQSTETYRRLVKFFEMLQKLLEERGLRLQLYFVVLQSFDLDFKTVKVSEVKEFRSFLRSFTVSGDDSFSLKIRLVSSDSHHELTHSLASLIAMDQKTTVLSL